MGTTASPPTDPGNPESGPPRRRRPGLSADFNRLWTAESVSLVGTEVTALALPLTAVYVLHAGTLQVGLLGTASWLPYVLFALVVGVWGDRIRRRRVLIVADLARAALLGVIIALAVTGTLGVPLLFVLAFLVGAGNVVFEVFYYSYVPSLVAGPDLLVANSRLQASESTAQVAGPGLGGLLIQLLSAPLALLMDAVSFLFSALMLSRIRTVEQVPETAGDQGSVLAQVRAGLALTWRSRVLLTLVGTAAICNLTAYWITVLFPLFCVRLLGLSAGMIGLVMSAGAVGSLLGAAVCGPFTRRVGVGQATLWTLFGEALGFLLLPFAPAHSWLCVPVLIAGWFIAGGTAAISRVVSISIRQTVTPKDYLGRVNATHRFVSYGVVAVGTAAGGFLGSALGIRVAMAVAAVAMMTSVVCVLVSPLLRMREVDDAVVVPLVGRAAATSDPAESDGGIKPAA
jgi:MFS family permease